MEMCLVTGDFQPEMILQRSLRTDGLVLGLLVFVEGLRGSIFLGKCEESIRAAGIGVLPMRGWKCEWTLDGSDVICFG